MRRVGGTGRRDGLKNRCPKGRVGSSPTLGTRRAPRATSVRGERSPEGARRYLLGVQPPGPARRGFAPRTPHAGGCVGLKRLVSSLVRSGVAAGSCEQQLELPSSASSAHRTGARCVLCGCNLRAPLAAAFGVFPGLRFRSGCIFGTVGAPPPARESCGATVPCVAVGECYGRSRVAFINFAQGMWFRWFVLQSRRRGVAAWRHKFLRDSGGTGFWHEAYFAARRHRRHGRRHGPRDRARAVRARGPLPQTEVHHPRTRRGQTRRAGARCTRIPLLRGRIRVLCADLSYHEAITMQRFAASATGYHKCGESNRITRGSDVRRRPGRKSGGLRVRRTTNR